MRRKRGFTLVELLVVIGIIAVLIGILLPSLNAARRQANAVKCASSLRQLGIGFQLYAGAYRDAYPVVRQDVPDDGGDGTGGTTGPTNVKNVYYSNMLLPFIAQKGAKLAYDIGSDKLSFDLARASVIWGCPSWDGWNGTATSTYVNGVSFFETGYSMNYYPTYKPDYPAAANGVPPNKELQMRWAGTYIGRYYKRNQWTMPADRMLMVESNLWLLSFTPVAQTGDAVQDQNATRAAASGAGSFNVDRYRHGKVPNQVVSGKFNSKSGGQVKYNILYCDGHVVTSGDINDAYKGIRMRAP